MNPLVMKIVAGAITGAVLFTAGWTVRGWKDSGKIQKLTAQRDAAVQEAQEKAALEAQWRQDLKDLRADLAAKAAEAQEKDRLYQEAVSRPPDIVYRYRDRVQTVTETIQSEDCNEGVFELFTFLQSLPERPQ